MRNPSLAAVILLTIACGAEHGSAPGTDAGSPDVSADAGVGSGPLEVATSSGALRGVEDGDSLAFLGVPYAAPPIGELRWRPPALAPSWDGVRDASRFGSPCVQPIMSYLDDDHTGPTTMGDEDCLYLNVWAPQQASSAGPLPVMVFLHGGGNVYGSSTEPLGSILDLDTDVILYDGARLAARGDVVVVTLNYRLGVLGFLAHPFLDATSEQGTSGNYGLLDQIQALEWVQTNIGAFGGDPERVLLFGQSGGGRDTTLLATSPLTGGLFAAVAIHSAPLGASSQEPVRERAAALVAEMGCETDTLACMRAADPFAMATAVASQPVGLANAAFLPTVDGHVVVEQPRQTIGAGRFRGVPVLFGTNADEYSHRWEGISAAGYERAIAAMVGPQYVEDVVRQYPLERFDTPREAFVTLMSDRNVTCPHSTFARTLAAAGYDAWLYRFEQRLPETVRVGYGASHTSELAYLFQHLDGEAFEVTDADQQTQEAMLRLWTGFARTGDPNGLPTEWPAFSLATEPYLAIDSTPSAEERLKAEDCAFWDALRAR